MICMSGVKIKQQNTKRCESKRSFRVNRVFLCAQGSLPRKQICSATIAVKVSYKKWKIDLVCFIQKTFCYVFLLNFFMIQSSQRKSSNTILLSVKIILIVVYLFTNRISVGIHFSRFVSFFSCFYFGTSFRWLIRKIPRKNRVERNRFTVVIDSFLCPVLGNIFRICSWQFFAALQLQKQPMTSVMIDSLQFFGISNAYPLRFMETSISLSCQKREKYPR